MVKKTPKWGTINKLGTLSGQSIYDNDNIMRKMSTPLIVSLSNLLNGCQYRDY